MAGFGLLGYLMAKFEFPPAPLLLGVVLGIGLERSLRQAMIMSQGDFLNALIHRPIAATALSLAALVLLLPLFKRLNIWRKTAVVLNND